MAIDRGPHPLRRVKRAIPAATVAVLLALACVASVPVGAPDAPASAARHFLITPGSNAPYATPGAGGPATTAPSLAVEAIERATDAPGVTLAVAVADLASGYSAGDVAATEPMYAASLVKVVLAVDVLQRRRSGLEVGPEALALIQRALGPSDDQAMNLLWTAFDGPSAVTRVARQLGLTATRPPADPSQWGESLVSARDMVIVYRHVLQDMPAWDRELIMGALAGAPPIAADGFDQAFGLQAPAAAPSAAAKQGWMCCPDDRINLHSVGTLGEQRRFVVALLSSQPLDEGYDGARETLTAAAAAARAALP